MPNLKIHTKMILILGLFFLTVAIGGTYAYYSDSITVENRIQLGDIDVSLVEYRLDSGGKERLYTDNLLILPGDNVSKIPRITCQAQPCYIRALITHGSTAQDDQPESSDLSRITPAVIPAIEYAESLSDENIYGFSDNWTKIGSYYYYTHILEPQESVDLFQGISIPGEWGNEHTKQELNLSIQIDAIQAEHFTPDFTSMQPWGDEEIEICAHSGDRSTLVNPYTTMYVEFEGNSHKLIAVPQDFFSNIGTAMPGDVLSDTVTLKNTTEDDVELFFHTALPDSLTDLQMNLLEQITLTISLDGEELYCGSLEAASLYSDISLGTYPSQRTGDFDFTLSIPDTLKNQYALADAVVKWVFSVRQNGFASPVKTSDTMLYIPFLFLGGSGVLLLCIYFVLTIRRISKETSDSRSSNSGKGSKKARIFLHQPHTKCLNKNLQKER